MKIIDVKQGTDEWLIARIGIPTASNFDKIITTKGERSKSREKYLYQLAGEKIVGKAEETYKNGAMQRGIEMEAEARQAYEIMTGFDVQQVGFCLADDGSHGASPDGLVGTDGEIEIKCPTLAVHVSYLLEGKLPTDYFQQTQGQLFVTGRKWLDFVSYYPGIKPLIVRVKPDKEFIEKLENEVKDFCADLVKVFEKLRS
jgi:putative phage-type endonuclease